MLSAASRSEQFLLIRRSVNRKVIPLNAAFIEAHAPLGEADQVVFAFFQLEGVDIEPLVDVACVEQKGVGWDGKQRLGQLPDMLNVECVPPLRCRKAYAG